MNYKNTKVLILGLGLNQGGVGSAKFFAKAGALVLVTDLKTKEQLKPSLDQLKQFKNIKYHLGEHKNEDIDWADLIIRNPKLTPNNPFLRYAKEKGKQVEMDMGIFLQFIKPSQIIGVTGTKGKSTTSSLIYEILKTAGKKVLFAGNIGKSVLDTVEYLKPNHLVVLELSSFQLESFDEHQLSPKWAVITNIYPDHLDYYQSMQDYIYSKKIIAKYQRKFDYLFLWKNDQVTISKDFLVGLKAKPIFFDKDDLPADFSPTIKGGHNLNNIAAALAVLKTLGVNQKKALEAVKQFKGVEFRLQLVKEVNGLKIYNDSAATNPVPAIEALKSFPNCILIAGGLDKGLDYKDFASQIDKTAKLVFFIDGTATDQIKKYLRDGKKVEGTYDNLERLLSDVKKHAKSKDIIVFAPGATSFNFFQNEFDRGRKFNAAVEKVFG
ncbi:UDP-N-acetylmuramoyl-L-alanine--D-glutamate ligase [Candidatus Daviesbacteria bacterium]|nr:UDP-N-acetylmuramoyl-L-alanine--D-glutamate ligase [Candidatus Daviesbacteria bacterium]